MTIYYSVAQLCCADAAAAAWCVVVELCVCVRAGLVAAGTSLQLLAQIGRAAAWYLRLTRCAIVMVASRLLSQK
jgi:hypothetical protein